jgi:SAM-dependent methyltransferase
MEAGLARCFRPRANAQRRWVVTDMDFTTDLKEGADRLSGPALAYFRGRVAKAAHILEELVLLGADPASSLTALCAGCNVGFIPYVLARHTAWKFIGGEFDQECVSRHPWVRQRVGLSRLDVTAMPFPDDSFDLVICNHVIEHVSCWERLAQELHRVVRPGGLVYVATPNIYRPLQVGILRIFTYKVPLRIMLKGKRHIARDTRIALHLGFALHELEDLFVHFSQLHNFNRIHASINSPNFVRPMLRLLPDVVYNYLLPTHVIIGRK